MYHILTKLCPTVYLTEQYNMILILYMLNDDLNGLTVLWTYSSTSFAGRNVRLLNQILKLLTVNKVVIPQTF